MAANVSAALPERAGRHTLALQIGTIGALAAVLVHAFVDFNLHIPANFLLIAFLFGMLAPREEDARFEKTGVAARLLHAIPAALGLWMWIVGAPRLSGEFFAETARGKIGAGLVRAGLEDAGHAISRGVRSPELFFQLGEVQRIFSQKLPTDEMRRNAVEDALDFYAKALAIYPQDAGIVLRNAWSLDRLGRFDEAEPLIAKAKQLDPNSTMVWVFSALHWKMRGMPAEALADYQKAVAIGNGWIPRVLADVGDTFDPAAMESLLKQGATVEPK
jgi:tetratricopeptide (TPR) repeat protein